jgi:hypothetical protein
VSEVDNNSNINAAPVSNLQIKQLEELEKGLQGKLKQRKDSLSQTGIVNDIEIAKDTQVQTINEALSRIKEARAADPRITNHLARAGQFGNVEHKAIKEVSVDSINAEEATQIKAFRSVPGMPLNPGQQFASLNGKEPSYNSYMRDNIEGLFALTALKG